MGTFCGIRIPYDTEVAYGKDYLTSKVDNTDQYFSNQSAFRFFKGFGIEELKLLLADAESQGQDTLWVPRERPVDGCIGLSTWYVRALIKQHIGDA